MAVIETQLDNQSEQFNSNAAVMASSTQQFRDIEKRVIDAAEAKAPRYLKKGLLPPRERLSQLLAGTRAVIPQAFEQTKPITQD